MGLSDLKRGWWDLTFVGVDELNESDREHIAEMIKEGYTGGEIIQEIEEMKDENTPFKSQQPEQQILKLAGKRNLYNEMP